MMPQLKILLYFAISIIIVYDMMVLYKKESLSMDSQYYLNKVTLRVILAIFISFYFFITFIAKYDVTISFTNKIFSFLAPLFGLIISFFYLAIYFTASKRSSTYKE